MAEDDTKLTIKVEVAEIGPAQKRLTIEIEAQSIADRIEDSYKKLATDATLAGFRKGRAPRRLMEKRFGKTVREDVCGQLLSEAYTQAIEENKLQVMGEPDVKDEAKIKLPDSGPMSFQIEVEVAPNVDLPDLEGIELQRTPLEKSDQDVDHELKQLCLQYGKHSVIDDAPAKATDLIEANVQMYMGHDVDADAEPFQTSERTIIYISGNKDDDRGHVGGIIVDDLAKRLIGKVGQDEVTIETTGPAGHENESIRDEPITIRIKVLSLNRFEPLPIEELHERFGLESADELRQQISDAVEARREEQQTRELHEQICLYLESKVNLELPEGMTGRQTTRLLQRRALDMNQQGASEQQIEQAMAEARQGSQEEAQRDLKRFFIIEKAADELDIEVSQRELNGRIASMAMRQGRRPEKLRQEMQRSGQLEYVFLALREQKTLDAILTNAKITDKGSDQAQAETEAEASTSDEQSSPSESKE